jgi:hypothetical protein
VPARESFPEALTLPRPLGSPCPCPRARSACALSNMARKQLEGDRDPLEDAVPTVDTVLEEVTRGRDLAGSEGDEVGAAVGP